MFWRRLFKGTIDMESLVCFKIAKYKKDIFSRFETSQKFSVMLSVFKKSIFIIPDYLFLNLIKATHNVFHVFVQCNAYLQYGIVYLGAVT